MENNEKSVRSSALLTPREICAFCTQLSMIIKSGITVEEGVSIMLEDQKQAKSREILSVVQQHIEQREPIYQALAAPGVFPAYMLHMVEVGERSGKLEEVIDSLCDYYDREDAVSRSIKNAVTYPLIMIAMMVLVIGVLVVKVLPVFQQVYRQLGSEMSGLSQGILAAGSAVSRYSVVILSVVAVLAVLLLIAYLTPKGRAFFTRPRQSVLFSRRLADKIASGRFAAAMAVTLSSGLDTDESLEMASRLVENRPLQEKITSCQKLIAEGVPFSDALARAEIFTGVYARMVAVGFKTGSADTVMQKLAAQYEEEVDEQISHVISVIEPTLVAILSIVVGMILLSVMLPLMGIMSSIG